MEDTILSIPIFVSNFAEAQISPEMYQALTAVLSDYFKREFKEIYERCQNSAFVINDG